MTQEHPIVPPRLLVEEWINDYWAKRPQGGYNRYIATRAAQWVKDQGEEEIKRERQEAADEELEECCKWPEKDNCSRAAHRLRAARRPKPPSLKEEALLKLKELQALLQFQNVDSSCIRRALESIPDHE